MKDCRMRNEGLGRLLQGIKLANLLNIRVMNLRGNLLGPRSIEYLRDACKTGVLANLRILILSNNELGDGMKKKSFLFLFIIQYLFVVAVGVGHVCTIISEGYFKSIVEIHLQNNSITDKGFTKMMKLLKSVQETRCPNIMRLGLENNLVSVETKRKYSPYPFYMSI